MKASNSKKKRGSAGGGDSKKACGAIRLDANVKFDKRGNFGVRGPTQTKVSGSTHN